MNALTAVVLSTLQAGQPASDNPSRCLTERAGTGENELRAVINANVLPMSSDTVLAGYTVLIRDGRIEAVEPMQAARVPPRAQIVDARGRYLIPGLIDAHVHVRAESELVSYLRYGVTTVLNMRGTPEHLAMRAALQRGTLPGPRLLTAGPLLDGNPPIWSGAATRIVSSPAEARAVVDEHVRAGYDFVKVYNNLDADLLPTVVRAARIAGLPVVGHLPRRPVRAQGLQRAAFAGLDLIAHGEEIFFTHLGGVPDSLLAAGGYQPPADEALASAVRMIQQAAVAVTPNLSFIAMTARMLADIDTVFGDPEFKRLEPAVQQLWRQQNPLNRRDLQSFRQREEIKFAVTRRLTAMLQKAGVLLLLGTDASAPGLYPGASAHVELAELVAAGLTPFEALSSGTRNAGTFIRTHFRNAPAIGVVAAGHCADLLLVENNPLRDLTSLQRPLLVIKGGRIVGQGARE